jgi:hypothetical protein
MRFAACGLVTVIGLSLLSGVRAGGDKKNPSEPPKERLFPAGNLLAEVLEANDGGKMLKLRIHTKVPDIKTSSSTVITVPDSGRPASR